MSTGCKSNHKGFLDDMDVSRSNGGLIRLDWPTVMFDDYSTSLSVAAFLRRAGSSMLESTGSHGRGVERVNGKVGSGKFGNHFLVGSVKSATVNLATENWAFRIALVRCI